MEKGSIKKLIIIGGIVLAICALVVVVMLARGNSGGKKLSNLLETGDRYLEELEYEQAIASYQAAIEIDPKCEEAYLGLAETYVAMEDYESAIDVLSKGLEQTDSEALAEYLLETRRSFDSKKVSDLLEAGGRYLEELEYEQAIASYQAAIEIDPKCEEAYLGLAKTYVTMEDYESAIEVLNKGIEQTGSEELARYLREIEEIDADEVWLEKATLYVYEADERSVYRYEINEYDGNGNLVKETSYNADESISYYCLYEYDGNGNLIKLTSYNADESISYYCLYEYDGNGNLIKLTSYNADESISYYRLYEYDGNGNLIKLTQYHADGSIFNYVLYEYDGSSRKCMSYRDDGTPQTYVMNEYDVDGKEIKTTYYYPDGSPEVYWITEYDGNGNKKKEISYDESGSISYCWEYEWEESRL